MKVSEVDVQVFTASSQWHRLPSAPGFPYFLTPCPASLPSLSTDVHQPGLGVPSELRLQVRPRRQQQHCGNAAPSPAPDLGKGNLFSRWFLCRGKWRCTILGFTTWDRASFLASRSEEDSLTTTSSQTRPSPSWPHHIHTQASTFYLL